MKRILKIIGLVGLILFCVVSYTYFIKFHHSMPWKTTNPHDSHFNPEEFKFEDYYDQYELREALRVVFPVGTSKEKVDQILFDLQPKYNNKTKWGASVKKILADPRRPKDKNVYAYYYTPYPNSLNIFVVGVYYDEAKKIIEITDHNYPIHNKNFYEEN